MTTSEERAWAGGFFEGEGCISSSADPKKGNVRMVMALTNTDLDRLELFQRIIGCGKIYVKKTDARRPTKVKPMWQWRIAAIADVRVAFAILEPWLGPRRLEQWRRHYGRFEQTQATKLDRIAAGNLKKSKHYRARLKAVNAA